MATGRPHQIRRAREDSAMSMQPINPNDLNERFDRMSGKWVTYIATLQDGLLAQMRVDKSDLQKDIATVREEVATLGEDVAALGEEVAAVRADLDALRAEVKQDIADLRAEVKQEVATLRGEMLARLAALQKRQEAADESLTEVKRLLLEVLANQRELHTYVDARAKDTDAIIANAVAQLSEQINELRRRLPPEASQG
jgi:chromosome segregation ATPase